MKVALFLSCYPELDNRRAPLGLGYLASYVGSKMDDVEFIVSPDLDRLIAAKPDLFGFTVLTTSFYQALRDVERVRQEVGCPIIGGGPHISAFPNHFDPAFDLAVLGEGEYTFLEILELYKAEKKFTPQSLSKIPGIAYRDENGNVIVSAKRPYVDNIDLLPPPDRKMLCAEWPHSDGQYSIMTSRGCPYECSFCSTTLFWGKRYRFHSKEYVGREIAELRNDFNPKMIRMWDDLFVVNKKRVIEMLNHLREHRLHEGIEFSAFVRANLMDDELMSTMAKTNFFELNIGFESASDQVLEKLNKRAVQAETNRRAARMAREHGMQFACTFIIGTPGETRDDVLASFDFVTSNMDVFKYVEFVPLIPLPGTQVFEWARATGTSETNLRGIAWDPEDFSDKKKFRMEKWPYLNDQCMPREEVAALIEVGQQITRVVAEMAGIRNELAHTRQLIPAQTGLDFVAANMPIRQIVQAKVSRRVKQMIGTSAQAAAAAAVTTLKG